MWPNAGPPASLGPRAVQFEGSRTRTRKLEDLTFSIFKLCAQHLTCADLLENSDVVGAGTYGPSVKVIQMLRPSTKNDNQKIKINQYDINIFLNFTTNSDIQKIFQDLSLEPPHKDSLDTGKLLNCHFNRVYYISRLYVITYYYFIDSKQGIRFLEWRAKKALNQNHTIIQL